MLEILHAPTHAVTVKGGVLTQGCVDSSALHAEYVLASAMADSSAPGAGARKAGTSPSAARKRSGSAPLAKEQRDLRALQNMSADLSRLARGGLDEEPATTNESEEGMTSASGASEGEARRAGGTSGTDAVPASSGDESFKQAGLKVRRCWECPACTAQRARLATAAAC